MRLYALRSDSARDLCDGVNCADGNACITDTGDTESGLCQHDNNTSACDDGNTCTRGDSCSGGSCVVDQISTVMTRIPAQMTGVTRKPDVFSHPATGAELQSRSSPHQPYREP